MIYYIFGSSDSVDCDIMVIVDAIGTIAESKVAMEQYASVLQPHYDRKININLAVIQDGIIADVFKGSVDECNNSVLHTYNLHPQTHSLQITRTLPRDPGLKALRSMRAILSFISRTQYRDIVKQALIGNAINKHCALNDIQLSTITEFGRKNINTVDFYKMLAFQMGQSYLLNQDVEVYTKDDISQHLPVLKTYLYRIPHQNPIILDNFKTGWLRSFDPATIPQHEELRK